MSNYPAPTNDSAISGLHPIDIPLTINDLLIISIKLSVGYYTGRISLDQIKQFILANTTALEIDGLSGLLDRKANVSHSHLAADISDLASILAGKANTNHTHNANQVNGLNSLLDGKANLIHTHEMNSISGLISALASKANIIHGHEITDVQGLKQKLDELDAWTSSGGSNHTHQIAQIDGLQSQLDGKALVIHNHSIDDISGLVLILASKAEAQHSHQTSDISDFQQSLDNKANLIHGHEIDDVNGLDQALDEKAQLRHSHGIDDVENLRTNLDGKASLVHNHSMTQIDGLDLAFNNKSDLDHKHSVTDIDGLDLALAEKAEEQHTHTSADISDLQSKLDAKAELVHQHGIDAIQGLGAELSKAEKVENKTSTMDVPSTVKYPTVDAVREGIFKILADYLFPVTSVNGLLGEVHITKSSIGLDFVDNTSDLDKPISTATQSALDLKVNTKLAGYQEHNTKGRVENGDDYVPIIEKLQWQIDVLRGLIPEPPVNGVTLDVNGHDLKINFARPVRFFNTPLENVDLTQTNIFQAIVSSDLLTQVGGVDYQRILTEVTSTSVSFKLLPGWVRPANMGLIDSVDHGGTGAGILKSIANIGLGFFNSIDGGLLDPRLTTTVPICMYTHLSEYGNVHNDETYNRAMVLGVWTDTPIYDYVSPETIMDIDLVKNSFTLAFNRAVLFKNAPMADYVGTPLQLIKDVFVPRPELDLLDQALEENLIETTVTDRKLVMTMKPGFFNKLVFEMLDSPDGGLNGNGDGIYRLLATVNTANFSTVSGEDITLTRSPDVRLTSYTNMSNYTPLHSASDYAVATIIGTWDDVMYFDNVPPIPVKDVSGGWSV